MKNKIGVLIGFGISAAVLITLFIYTTAAGEINSGELLLITGVLLLVAGATWILIDRMKNVRAGLPAKDELSNKLMYKAGYYAYLASIYIALALMWYSTYLEETGSQEIAPRHVAEGMILLPAIVFMGSYFHLKKRGKIE